MRWWGVRGLGVPPIPGRQEVVPAAGGTAGAGKSAHEGMHPGRRQTPVRAGWRSSPGLGRAGCRRGGWFSRGPMPAGERRTAVECPESTAAPGFPVRGRSSRCGQGPLPMQNQLGFQVVKETYFLVISQVGHAFFGLSFQGKALGLQCGDDVVDVGRRLAARLLGQ